MKWRDIVNNFILSKKLKAKGFPQEDGLFYWWEGKNSHFLTSRGWDGKPLKRYKAVTSEEILKELPLAIIQNEVTYKLSIYRLLSDNGLYRVVYNIYNIKNEYIVLENDWQNKDRKLCNALVKMWLFLKDSNLIGDKK